jgi:arginine decarboxylase
MPDEVEYFLIGNRVPKDYFEAEGFGEHDLTDHAGSFDESARKAGVENYNILKYTSIMPGIARKVDRPKRDVFEIDYKGKAKIVHGSVCEVIMAEKTSIIGERATAGLVVGWIYDNRTRKRYGGLVAEYSGSEDEPVAREKLDKMMKSMAKSRLEDRKHLELGDVEIRTISGVPKKKYGTAIVLIGFLNYVIPKFGELTQKDLDGLYAYKSLDVRPVDGKDATPKAEATAGGNKALR